MLWIVAPRQPKIPWSTSPTAQTSSARRADQLHERALGDVGVLVLVEEHVAEALTEPIEDLRPRCRSSSSGEHDLVAEVDRVSLDA